MILKIQPIKIIMSQQIIIAEQARLAALLTDDRVDELIVAQGQYQIGDIFLGTVENVLPELMRLSLILVKVKKMIYSCIRSRSFET